MTKEQIKKGNDILKQIKILEFYISQIDELVNHVQESFNDENVQIQIRQ